MDKLKYLTPKSNENKLRAYNIHQDGMPYWGVTSILSYVFGIPPELNKWSVKVAMQAVFNAEKLARLEKKKLTQKERVEIAQQARVDYLKASQVKGTTVHDLIEQRLKSGKHPKDIDAEYEPYYLGFAKFIAQNQIEPVLQEERVWCDHHKFAGRIDFYGKIWTPGGEINALIDFKTSNFLKDDYGLQLAAYRHCLEDFGHKVDAMYILHLQANGIPNLVRYYDTFDEFLLVRKVFAWKARKQKPEFYWATDQAALERELNVKKEEATK